MQVTRDNTTVIHTDTGEVKTLYDDHDLFFSMTGAGQSYGIVTEFLYKVKILRERLKTYFNQGKA